MHTWPIIRPCSGACPSTWVRPRNAKSPQTDQRVLKYAQKEDPQLAALFFQFGRYLLIASSPAGRPAGQPAGALERAARARRGTASRRCNINTEMNYWPAEPTQPGRVHRAAVRRPGRDRARRAHDGPGALRRAAAGCCTTTSTCGAAPPRSTPPTTASGRPAARGSASISGSITSSPATRSSWRERAYPLMKGGLEFFVDYLVEDPRTTSAG